MAAKAKTIVLPLWAVFSRRRSYGFELWKVEEIPNCDELLGVFVDGPKRGDWETRRSYSKITVAKREAFAKKRPPHT